MMLSPTMGAPVAARNETDGALAALVQALQLANEMNDDLRRQNVELNVELQAARGKLDKVCIVFDKWRAEDEARRPALASFERGDAWRG